MTQLFDITVFSIHVLAHLFLDNPTDREGFGMEELKKRKAEEELNNYRQKVRAKQQNEAKFLEDFR